MMRKRLFNMPVKARIIFKDSMAAMAMLLMVFLLWTEFSLVLGGTPVSAREEASASSGDMIVSGYTVTRGGNKKTGKIEQNYRVNLTVDVRRDGLTAEQAGKITVTATSSSFRIPKNGVSVETVSPPDAPLSMKIRFTDIVYKGTGDGLHFKLSYQNGGRDEGDIHVYECVETEKPFRKSSSSDSGDGKNKRETHYGAPPLLISHTPLGVLEPGQEFQMKIKVQNLSPRLTASDLMVSIAPSDGVLLLGDSSTRYIRGLAAKQSEFITLDLMAAKELSSPSQSVGVTVKYNYFENDQRTAASTEEKLTLAFDPDLTGKNDVATPNIIISKYDYGDRVAVGETFDLTLALQNTSPDVPVENLVVTLETGDGLTVVNSSNTFFVPEMEAGGGLTKTVKVQALPVMQGAKPDYKMEVTFKYEYMAGNKRTPVTGGEKLGIPVYQPDRFKVFPPSRLEPVVAGEETTVSLSYVNKGKGEVSNVEAALSGEVDALETHQNLGNFEAGKSGTIDFVITPRQAGETKLAVKITYEDGNLQTKTVEIPVTLTVGEAAPEAPVLDMQEEEAPPDYRWMIWSVTGLCALLLGALLIHRKRLKRRRQENCLKLAWDEEESKVVHDETA